MKIIDIEQGTPEWHEWRQGKASASDAAIIMGCAPAYWETRTWDDLRLKQAGLATEPTEWAKKAWAYGHQHEPAARKRLEEQTHSTFAPVCIEMEGDSRFAASLDGYCHTSGEWAEIKCPISGERSTLWKALGSNEPMTLKERIPPHIRWQLVHQAMVRGKPHGRCYLVCRVNEVNRTLIVDPYALFKDVPALKDEWDRFLAGEEQSPASIEFEDAAKKWLDANATAKKAADLAKQVRTALIDCTPGDKASAFGVSVARIEKAGSIDWPSVARHLWSELNTRLNLESEEPTSRDMEIELKEFEAFAETYRKDGLTMWTVRETKS